MSGVRGREADARGRGGRAVAGLGRAVHGRGVCTVLLVTVVSFAACGGLVTPPNAAPSEPVALRDRDAPPRPGPSEPGRLVAHIGIGRVNAVRFAPVGNRLAVATTLAVELWNTETWLREAVLDGARGARSLSFAADGAVLAAGSDHPLGSITLWDTSSRQTIATLDVSDERRSGVGAVNLSADGRLLASAGGGDTVKLWDVASRGLIAVVDGAPRLSLSPDGSLLALGGPGHAVRLWDVTAEAEVAALAGRAGHGASVAHLAFSPDGATLATVYHWEREFYTRLWDVPARRELRILADAGHHVQTLAFSLDGALLATAGMDKIIRLWDVSSGRLVARLEGHLRGVNSLSFSPNGSMLASGGLDAVVLVWDVASGRLQTTLSTDPAATPPPR